MNFNDFLNYSEVVKIDEAQYEVQCTYNYYVYVRVNISNEWIITDNEHLTIDTERKKDKIFDMVSDFIKDNQPEDTNDYEHPGIAGGIYSDLY